MYGRVFSAGCWEEAMHLFERLGCQQHSTAMLLTAAAWREPAAPACSACLPAGLAGWLVGGHLFYSCGGRQHWLAGRVLRAGGQAGICFIHATAGSTGAGL
jgi:hypothetical protein